MEENENNEYGKHLDSDIVKINDWKELSNFTGTKMKDAMLKIQEFWEALGLDEAGANVRRQNFAIQFKEFVEKCIDSERLHNHLVQKSVLDVAAQLEEMANALNYNIPIISDISKKPLALLDELNQLMVELSAEKHTRISHYNELTAQIRDMCKILDQHESIPKLNSFTKRFNGVENQKSKYIPSSEELDVLDNYLNNLTKELNDRKGELENIRESILDILLKMGRNSQDPKYLPLFNTKFQNLSKSFIDTIQRYHDELFDENNQCKQKYDTLWEEIEYWWEKLDTDNLERNVVRARYRQNYGYETIKSLEQIIGYIIKERLDKIGQYVEKQRKILKATLENCYAFYNRRNADLFGGEEVLELAKTKFDPKDIVMNTEAYLIRLETAVDVALNYYNENATLFNMIQRREQLWSELCTFESTPLTSDRLKNRGGILLKEEKIRKRIYKDLPSLQQQLVITIMDWQNKYNSDKTRTFYWQDNTNYVQLLHEQWENRIALTRKLYHPDESISKCSKQSLWTPTKKLTLDKCHDSPRTPLASSFSSNSIRSSRVVKRANTPATLQGNRNRTTPFTTNASSNKSRVVANKARDIILPKVPKLTFSSPIVEKNKTHLLPLPNIPAPILMTNENVPTNNDDIVGSKMKSKKKPQLN